MKGLLILSRWRLEVSCKNYFIFPLILTAVVNPSMSHQFFFPEPSSHISTFLQFTLYSYSCLEKKEVFSLHISVNSAQTGLSRISFQYFSMLFILFSSASLQLWLLQLLHLNKDVTSPDALQIMQLGDFMKSQV